MAADRGNLTPPPGDPGVGTANMDVAQAVSRLGVLIGARPLIFFDLETTGPDAERARIIDLAVVKVFVNDDGDVEHFHHVWRFNPRERISPEATKIHGITDDDVAICPPFSDRAAEVYDIFRGCDLCGYNAGSFDVKVLRREFEEAHKWRQVWPSADPPPFPEAGAALIDPYAIFALHAPRDLVSAVKFYEGEAAAAAVAAGAHDALADTLMVIRVLSAQVERPGMPRSPRELGELCRRKERIDFDGKFAWRDGEAIINFTKHKGTPLRELAAKEPGLLKWILKNDFSAEVKGIARDALDGKFPVLQEP